MIIEKKFNRKNDNIKLLMEKMITKNDNGKKYV